MSYSKFTTLGETLERFELHATYDAELFPIVAPATPGELLVRTLEDYLPLALAINTEKARSEFLIAPILAEVRRRSGLTLFSGIEFNVAPKQGLAGFCDFLLSRSNDPFTLQAPVLTIVEAKREDIPSGLGQCAAEMVAARIFNERAGRPSPPIWGAVTTGELWRFLRLEGSQLTVDRDNETLHPLERLLGILLDIARGE